jgi:hypothetical protein
VLDQRRLGQPAQRPDTQQQTAGAELHTRHTTARLLLPTACRCHGKA